MILRSKKTRLEDCRSRGATENKDSRGRGQFQRRRWSLPAGKRKRASESQYAKQGD